MKYRTRRILSLILLLVWLPLYIVAAVTVTGWFDRPHILLELAIYAGLGFLWALPFRRIFQGVGREDPDRDGD
ncbi:MAG TPA: DUF2842 domain-containing protein [Thermohalobaculum sp.]|nr:DUF2842 domain-containing protein [Thermohalobaculum sp.]